MSNFLSAICVRMRSTPADSRVRQTRCVAPYSSVSRRAADRSGLVEEARRSVPPVGIRHKELPEMRVRVAEQLEAVLTWGRRASARGDTRRRTIVLHRAESNEALAHQPLPRCRVRELLEVRSKGRLGLARQPPCAIQPFSTRGAGVHIVGGRIRVRRLALPQNHPDEVVRAELQVTGPHMAGDILS